MRVKVILNPWADRGRAAQLQETLEGYGAEYGGLDVVLTQAPGHAAILARLAAEDGYELLGVSGRSGLFLVVAHDLCLPRPVGPRPGVSDPGRGRSISSRSSTIDTNLESISSDSSRTTILREE